MTDPSFDIDQALRAQRSLRDRLGLEEERFPVPAFVEMISDEIEQMRAAGHSDDDIVAVVAEASGVSVPAAAIAQFYIEPTDRHGGEHRG